RLLIDEPLDGAANMARDEAILIAQAAGAAPPTLRLYRWRPACLSLGRFQRSDQIDRAACERSGVEVVRRPSGGRAILHDDELTSGSRKLIGSAQMRRGGALLQHGSILLAPHADRLAALLIAPPADLGAKMIALGELLDRQVAFEEVVQAILGGFEEAWGIA